MRRSPGAALPLCGTGRKDDGRLTVRDGEALADDYAVGLVVLEVVTAYGFAGVPVVPAPLVAEGAVVEAGGVVHVEVLERRLLRCCWAVVVRDAAARSVGGAARTVTRHRSAPASGQCYDAHGEDDDEQRAQRRCQFGTCDGGRPWQVAL